MKRSRKKYKIEYEYYEPNSFLWLVLVIYGEEILLEKKVIARDEVDARVKAGMWDVLKEKNLKPSQAKLISKILLNLKEEKK